MQEGREAGRSAKLGQHRPAWDSLRACTMNCKPRSRQRKPTRRGVSGAVLIGAAPKPRPSCREAGDDLRAVAERHEPVRGGDVGSGHLEAQLRRILGENGADFVRHVRRDARDRELRRRGLTRPSAEPRSSGQGAPYGPRAPHLQAVRFVVGGWAYSRMIRPPCHFRTKLRGPGNLKHTLTYRSRNCAFIGSLAPHAPRSC